ncbi:MAG TPA: citrate/2-methylcitrate synthase [Methanomassiliicoccaceae archaeon]|jgi:citrate synthase|nr:citrate/2-methylcitrate synthase [Methanomassiliicoccaceae archaeon]
MVGTENTGLRGIRVATSRISLVDGEAGRLLYRGYAIEDLARWSTFEEVSYLLLYGQLPTAEQLRSFSHELASHRALPPEMMRALRAQPLSAPPMAVLSSMVSLMPGTCPDRDDDSPEANRRKAVRIISMMPTIVAAWKRLRRGQEPVDPDPRLPHADNFLYMIWGEEQSRTMNRFLDVALILQADHGFNASTFTTRVVASTRASIYSAVAAGVCALSGPLHGGANAQVMKNLLDVNDPDSVEAWVAEQFKHGRRVSGMGHAVYKTMDPRAAILQSMAHRVMDVRPEFRWYEMTERMIIATQEHFRIAKGREIYPNIDMYTASIYHAMGIDPDFYPAVFAMARSAGWTAHVMEEKFPCHPVKPVLYRPVCTYVGDVDLEYTPIEKR